jgi:hypothetical protein
VGGGTSGREPCTGERCTMHHAPALCTHRCWLRERLHSKADHNYGVRWDGMGVGGARTEGTTLGTLVSHKVCKVAGAEPVYRPLRTCARAEQGGGGGGGISDMWSSKGLSKNAAVKPAPPSTHPTLEANRVASGSCLAPTQHACYPAPRSAKRPAWITRLLDNCHIIARSSRR